MKTTVFIAIFLTLTVYEAFGCTKTKEFTCPDKFEKKNTTKAAACLHFSKEKANFQQAAAICRDLGSRMFTPKNMGLFEFLRDQTESYFVGLADTKKDGMYRWTDDGSVAESELLPKMFYKGNVHFMNVPNPCALYSPVLDKSLIDTKCVEPHYYVCQAKGF